MTAPVLVRRRVPQPQAARPVNGGWLVTTIESLVERFYPQGEFERVFEVVETKGESE